MNWLIVINTSPNMSHKVIDNILFNSFVTVLFFQNSFKLAQKTPKSIKSLKN